MAKRQLTEGNLVIDFVEAIFDAIVRQRNKVIQKTAEKDPEFQRIAQTLVQGREELMQWAKEKAKKDPSFALALKNVQSRGE